MLKPFSRWLTLCILCAAYLSPNVCTAQKGSLQESIPIEDISRFIIEGREAPRNRFAYICSIRKREDGRKYVCTGFLVHKRWVITAAHCVDDNDSESAGSEPVVYCSHHHVNQVDDQMVFNAVAKVHPKYEGHPERGNDIALLRIDREAEVSLPIIHRGSKSFQTRLLTVLGWGRTETAPVAEFLQMSEELSFVPADICNTPLIWNGIVEEDRMICLGGIGGRNPCKGDSGAPLINTDAPDGNLTAGDSRIDQIVGLVSFGDKECNPNRPTVFTKLEFHLNWIEETIADLDAPLEAPEQPESKDSDEDDSVRAADVERLERFLAQKSPEELTQQTEHAVENDFDVQLEASLNLGVDVDTIVNRTRDDRALPKTSLLSWAAAHKSTRCAKLLVRRGADLESEDSAKNTPVLVAAKSGSLEIAEFLIESGANINAVSGFDEDLMACAIIGDSLEIVEFVNKLAGIKLRPYSEYMDTAGGFASRETIEKLIEYGAEVNWQDGSGITALMWAASPRVMLVIRFIGDDGFNTEDPKELPPPGTPGRHSRYGRGDAILPLFLQDRFKSPLAKNRDFQVVETLLKNGASANLTDNVGKTALHHASYSSDPRIIKLLAEGTSVNQQDGFGATPLHELYLGGTAEGAEALINEGADVNVQDFVGDTPLHLMFSRPRVSIAEVLLKNGADPSIRNSKGINASQARCDLGRFCNQTIHDALDELLEKYA